MAGGAQRGKRAKAERVVKNPEKALSVKDDDGVGGDTEFSNGSLSKALAEHQKAITDAISEHKRLQKTLANNLASCSEAISSHVKNKEGDLKEAREAFHIAVHAKR